jgi:hypothetical protein
MDIFEKLADRVKSRWKNTTSRLKAYLKRLLFPLKFFPQKLKKLNHIWGDIGVAF